MNKYSKEKIKYSIFSDELDDINLRHKRSLIYASLNDSQKEEYSFYRKSTYIKSIFPALIKSFIAGVSIILVFILLYSIYKYYTTEQNILFKYLEPNNLFSPENLSFFVIATFVTFLQMFDREVTAQQIRLMISIINI